MTSNDRINGLNQGVAFKAPVRVATTANITLSGLQTIDGITVVANDRVLVKDQTDQTQNGIYLASASAWSRDVDFDGSRDVTEGTIFFVLSGTVSAGFVYKLTTATTPTDPVAFGTDNITFSLALDLSAISSITAYGVSLVNLADVDANRTLLGLKKNNYAGTAAPTTGDDSADGYEVGSQWYDATNDNMYHCMDATLGAAVWVQGDIVAADLGSAAIAALINSDTFTGATTGNINSATATKNYFDNNVKGTKATQSSVTAIGTATWTTIAFNTEEFDDADWHDNSTNNSRITVDEDGRYSVSGAIVFNSTSNGDNGIRILVNGSVVKKIHIDTGTTSENQGLSISDTLQLSDGDYVELQGYIATGVNTVTTGTFLTVQRIKIGTT